MKRSGIVTSALAGLAMSAALSAAITAEAADLTILHINDHHSHLGADGSMDLILAGERTRVSGGGFPMLAAQFKTLSASRQNVSSLSGGNRL